jgi:TRAP-type C4-dicarboxylate transport system permease small subunit
MRDETPPGSSAAPQLDHLFEEWREQEAHVDLSDLSWADSLVFVVFWALFGVVFLQFYTRYVLNDALGWTEEIARYLLIGVTFIGSVTAMRKGSHIAVEVVLMKVPAGLRHWLMLAMDTAVMLFCGLMAWHGWELGNRAPGFMVSIDVPKSIIYWGVALALAAMTLHAAHRLWRRLRRTISDEPHGAILD